MFVVSYNAMMSSIILPAAIFVLGILGLLSLKRGAFFVPTHSRAVNEMTRLLEIRQGDLAVDLGSGDGRIVIALARAGAEAHGYEHNPLLVWWSRMRIRRLGLSGRAFIHREDFWKVNLSRFSVVTVFGIRYIMKSLEQKLEREGKTDLRVASYTFRFPTWQPVSATEGIYIYRR